MFRHRLATASENFNCFHVVPVMKAGFEHVCVVAIGDLVEEIASKDLTARRQTAFSQKLLRNICGGRKIEQGTAELGMLGKDSCQDVPITAPDIDERRTKE